MPSDVKWRKREKRNVHHEKASFFHIAEFSNGFCFVLFLRKRLFHFLSFVNAGKNQVKLSEAAVRRCSSK